MAVLVYQVFDPKLLIRRAEPDENEAIRCLIQVVADETFAHLFPGQHVPIGYDDWSLAWLGVYDGRTVGVALTSDEYVSDLWVLPGWRRGVGQPCSRWAKER